MKSIFPLCLAAGMLVFGTVSCKEKKKSDDIIVAKYVPEQPKDPIRLNNDLRHTDTKWLNAFYAISTNRTANESLPMLTDEIGQQYIDNQVTVTVQRTDSSIFFKQVFTKESFTSYLDSDFRKNGYLENIIFQNVENGCLKFGVAISRPGSEDEFIPLDLFIDRQGGLRITEGHIFDEINDSIEG